MLTGCDTSRAALLYIHESVSTVAGFMSARAWLSRGRSRARRAGVAGHGDLGRCMPTFRTVMEILRAGRYRTSLLLGERRTRAHAAAAGAGRCSNGRPEASLLPSSNDSEAGGAGGALLELEAPTRLAMCARRQRGSTVPPRCVGAIGCMRTLLGCMQRIGASTLVPTTSSWGLSTWCSQRDAASNAALQRYPPTLRTSMQAQRRG